MSQAKTVLLMRHAKSSWAEPGLDDHERPLNSRGRRGAPQMGARIKELDLVPDRVIVSTAVRAQQTANEVIAASGYSGTKESNERLYLAEPAVYFDLFTEVPEGTERLLLIAHNPGIADLVEIMTGTSVEMCTAGLAEIACEVAEISEITSQTRCMLRGFHRP